MWNVCIWVLFLVENCSGKKTASRTIELGAGPKDRPSQVMACLQMLMSRQVTSVLLINACYLLLVKQIKYFQKKDGSLPENIFFTVFGSEHYVFRKIFDKAEKKKQFEVIYPENTLDLQSMYQFS